MTTGTLKKIPNGAKIRFNERGTADERAEMRRHIKRLERAKSVANERLLKAQIDNKQKLLRGYLNGLTSGGCYFSTGRRGEVRVPASFAAYVALVKREIKGIDAMFRQFGYVEETTR